MVIVYEGPHAAVDVPAAGLVGIERGKPVEVSDDITVVVGVDIKSGKDIVVPVAESLLEQGTWAKALTKRTVTD